jgi:hypothetical protein
VLQTPTCGFMLARCSVKGEETGKPMPKFQGWEICCGIELC